MISVSYDPSKDRYPLSVLKIHDNLKIFFKVKDDCYVNEIRLVIRHELDNKELIIKGVYSGNSDSYNLFTFEVSLDEVGLYWYHFDIDTNLGFYRVFKGKDYKAKIGEDEEFPISVRKSNIVVNKSLYGGIIYHVFVDRFNKVGKLKDSRNLVYRDIWGEQVNKITSDKTLLNYEVYGGNIKGIINKLDYLKGLNVKIIYLSPIFLASSNHKYDTSDFSVIDPMFGSKKDLINLINKAKEKGIEIILDGVFNHVGSDSIYFNKENRFNVIGAYNSKKSKYYSWFRFNNYPFDYDSWWGIKTLPSLNQDNVSLKRYLRSIIKDYMSLGLLGFRLDVVDELKDSYLDNIVNSIRSVRKDSLILGEVWEDASIKIAYSKRRQYFINNQLNSVMNYPLKDSLIDYCLTKNTTSFSYTYRMIENNYPNEVKHLLMNLISTHDTNRILTILNNDIDLLKIISALEFTFYGLAGIYYGDEIGLVSDDNEFSRVCFDIKKKNVEVYNWYKLLTNIRKDKLFKDSKMELIKDSDGIISFYRSDLKDTILVITNLSSNIYTYNDGYKYKSLITDKIYKEVIVNDKNVDILKRIK